MFVFIDWIIKFAPCTLINDVISTKCMKDFNLLARDLVNSIILLKAT